VIRQMQVVGQFPIADCSPSEADNSGVVSAIGIFRQLTFLPHSGRLHVRSSALIIAK